MHLYHGIDIIEIERIERAIARWGERFLQRVFTPTELATNRTRPASLAARWAAKEATAKLLGVGLRGLGAGQHPPGQQPIRWTEIEVQRASSGQPQIVLYGQAAERARELGLGPLTLSLSHSRTQAIASVVALTKELTTDRIFVPSANVPIL